MRTSVRFLFSLLVLMLPQTLPAQSHPTRYGLPDAWDSFSTAGIVNMKKDAGAVGDGKTDDTAAFQAVFGAGKHAKHPRFGSARHIYIPPGTYLISDTIRWGDKKKFVRGAGTERTVLRLAAGTFPDADQPRHVLDVKGEQFMAQNFAQRVMDLTVEVERDNAGAIGVGFHTNNIGGIANVAIRSLDPNHRGFAGLDLYGNTGPGLCWNIEIDGFEYGVHSKSKLHSMTVGRMTFRNQRKAAVLNDRQSLFLSHVVSDNAVPFLMQGGDGQGGFVTLVEATLKGHQSRQPAMIVEDGAILLRDVSASGYAATLRYLGESIRQPNVACWGRPVPPDAPAGSLSNLPRRLPPVIDYGDPEQWAVVPPGRGEADLRAAVDSGARVVFVPPSASMQLNQTVELPASLEVLHGFGTTLRTGDGFVKEGNIRDPLWEGKHNPPAGNNRAAAVWRVGEESSRALTIQFLEDAYGQAGWGVEHAATRELVLWACHATYRNSVPGGTVFLLDVGGAPFHFINNHAYVWQINTESYNYSPHVMNEGGRLWICGHKTEKDRTALATTAGGWTELNGGWYMKNRERIGETPMITVSQSRFSGAFTNTYLPYEVLLEYRGERDAGELRVEDAGRTVGLVEIAAESRNAKRD